MPTRMQKAGETVAASTTDRVHPPALPPLWRLIDLPGGEPGAVTRAHTKSEARRNFKMMLGLDGPLPAGTEIVQAKE